MPSYNIKSTHRPASHDLSKKAIDAFHVIDDSEDDYLQIQLPKRSEKSNQPKYISRIQQLKPFQTVRPAPGRVPKEQAHRKGIELSQEYIEDAEDLSDDSDTNYFSNVDEDILDGDIIELSSPKQAARRWRGKGVSKAEYEKSTSNYIFGPSVKNRERGKEDEDETENQGVGGRQPGGDRDGDENEDGDNDMEGGLLSSYRREDMSYFSGEPSGMRRTHSGMFMPYEEDEDDIVPEGLFRRVVATVNTAKDMLQFIWNVGRR
jgi:hypothetical protein